MQRRTALFLMAGLTGAIRISGAGEDDAAEDDDTDTRIREFLETTRGEWLDMNVPYEDGEALYTLIVEHGYTRALEIGTSTGLSGVWIARGLRETGGQLITIELDVERHGQACENFRAAGVEDIIDARLGDAHELVRELPGPFDFVFSDADKEWYDDYLRIILPKLTVGGCFTAHNVTNDYAGIAEFRTALDATPNLDTTIIRTSAMGISASFKTSE